MNDFQLYLKLGFDHILDLSGYDHIIFILSFCAIYNLKQWKKVLVLISLFTITHSFSLILSGLEIIYFSPVVVEILIPFTILTSCLYNIFLYKERESNNLLPYILVPFFGLIHGLGFSSFFKMIISEDENIVFQLLSFNLGIEIGQILVVSLSFLLLFIFNNLLDLSMKFWRIMISTIIGIISTLLILDII